MAAERLSMRQIREILRQKWTLGLSHLAVARSPGVGQGTISSVLTRAEATGLDWPRVQTLLDDVLESRLYGRPEVAGQRQRPWPDCAWIHAERRKPGVHGYRYTRFCDIYRRWLKRRGLWSRNSRRQATTTNTIAKTNPNGPIRRPLNLSVSLQILVRHVQCLSESRTKATRRDNEQES